MLSFNFTLDADGIADAESSHINNSKILLIIKLKSSCFVFWLKEIHNVLANKNH